MPGVSSVNVDFGKKCATVEMKQGSTFDKKAAATALKRGGYTIKI
jgi:hypothetical protein